MVQVFAAGHVMKLTVHACCLQRCQARAPVGLRSMWWTGISMCAGHTWINNEFAISPCHCLHIISSAHLQRQNGIRWAHCSLTQSAETVSVRGSDLVIHEKTRSQTRSLFPVPEWEGVVSTSDVAVTFAAELARGPPRGTASPLPRALLTVTVPETSPAES